MNNKTFEEMFPLRLAKLRCMKGVSARDMSLSIGQNAGYINNIENGRALPSMSSFFYICEFLDITPKEFFNDDTFDTEESEETRLFEELQQLDEDVLKSISLLVSRLIKK